VIYIKLLSYKDNINSLINWGIPLKVLFNKKEIKDGETTLILALRNSDKIEIQKVVIFSSVSYGLNIYFFTIFSSS